MTFCSWVGFNLIFYNKYIAAKCYQSMNHAYRLMLFFSFTSQQTCSHGTACNFIHCFRNPGGDYEWADSDKPPPNFWVKQMAALFGHSDDYEISRVHGNLCVLNPSSNVSKTDSDRWAFNWLLGLRTYINECKLREVVVIFCMMEENQRICNFYLV